LDISEGDVTENAIAENMLDVLDTLDELVSGADQRLMENEGKPKGPRPLAGALEPPREGTVEAVTDEYGDMFADPPLTKEGHTTKPEHGGSVKRSSFKLPAWRAIMDEDTPPGSPFSRTLFAEDHVEGEPVMELVPDHLVQNDEEVKAKVEPFEPLMTSTAAVTAMFEKFLGPNNTAETAKTVCDEGKSQQQVEKANEKSDDKRDSVRPVPPLSPRIVRRRQQQQKDEAREPQAAVVESQPSKSKSPIPRSRSACTNNAKGLYPRSGRSKEKLITTLTITTISSQRESILSLKSRLRQSLPCAPVLLSAGKGPGLVRPVFWAWSWQIAAFM